MSSQPNSEESWKDFRLRIRTSFRYPKSLQPVNDEIYEPVSWKQACDDFFSDLEAPFPRPPQFDCKRNGCIRGDKLMVCHHEVERTLMDVAGNKYSVTWLKKERLRWHPDRFSNRIESRFLAQEIFQLIQSLIDEW